MKRRTFLTTTAGGAVATAAGLSAPAYATGKRKLKMVTTWPKKFPGLGTRAEEFAKDIETATDGRIRIKVYAGNELVPPLGAFDAVRGGKADIYHGSEYYWQGKHKAFSFFTAIPFGLTAMEQSQWLNYGGGQKLWDELSGKFNIKALACTNSGVQMGGWFKKEMNSVEDFKGLRMRIPGLGGEVLKRLGATPVTKAGGEIYLALSQGNIDASEWVGPWNDLAFGFHNITKYYYTSAFQEPGAAIAAGFNLDVWNSLSKADQAIIKAVAGDNYQKSLAEFNSRNAASLRVLVEKHGVLLRTYSDEILIALARTSDEVMQEIATTDDLTKRIYNSYMDTRRAAMEWRAIADEPYLRSRHLYENFGKRL
ncbi:MAG: ABC transporter substrate-binding protein [Alphaproteobacteria bacterium]|nr:MAG: ABC transporter substrate-binding protein [Alphaproteobacteria bacterium]